jgi:hypothetical protein
MIALFSTTIISCSDALGIISRLSNVIGLSYSQKVEIVKTIKEHIPSCPVYIKPNEKSK